MQFSFTEEQAMIADTAKGFFAEHATSARTRAAMAADGIDHELWRGFCEELGLAGVALPEAHGGSGLGMVEFAILAEAAGAQVAALPLLGVAQAGRALAAGGTDVQKRARLPQIASGKAIAACAVSQDAQARAGGLSGRFDFVPHGGVADTLVLFGPSGGWVVDAKAAGVGVATRVTLDQTRPLAALTLDGAAAEPLADWRAARRAADEAGWICVAAEALGGAQATLDRTVEYSKQRVQFDRPIGSFQAYKHRLADMMVEIEQARSAVYWAACAVDEDAADKDVALHGAKSFAADTFFRCAGDMIQLHGGIGFTWEHDAHLFFKRARAIQSMLGGSAWHRDRVADLILGPVVRHAEAAAPAATPIFGAAA